ncbi:MAG TPA: ribosome maturation factor RimM [Cyclobacteriaceae bacterium]
MDIDSCYQVGYVIKKHGLKGDIKVILSSPLPKKLESIFVEIDNRLVPFFIEHISILHDQAILKLEDIDSPDKADHLAQNRVFLPLSARPKSQSKSPNSSELIGFSVYFDTNKLGVVSDINKHALNPLLVVKGEKSEVLIPINDYFIKKVDLKAKKVTVELPDGFLEI